MRGAIIAAFIVVGCVAGPKYSAQEMTGLHTIKLCMIAVDGQATDRMYAMQELRSRKAECDYATILPYMNAEKARRDAANMEMFRAGQDIMRSSNPPVNPALIPPPPINCQSNTIDGRTYTTCR